MAGLDSHETLPEHCTEPRRQNQLIEQSGSGDKDETGTESSTAAPATGVSEGAGAERSDRARLVGTHSAGSKQDASSQTPPAARRSSIRPVPGWRPQNPSRPSAPMVVVFSGNSEQPPPPFSADDTVSRPKLETSSVDNGEPFPFADDLGGRDCLGAEEPNQRAAELNGGVAPDDTLTGTGSSTSLAEPPGPARSRTPTAARGGCRTSEPAEGGRATESQRAQRAAKPSRFPMWAVAVASVTFVGALFVFGRSSGAEGTGPSVTEQASPRQVEAAAPQTPSAITAVPELPSGARAVATPAPAPEQASSAADDEDTLARTPPQRQGADRTASPGTRRVVLEVAPSDAKVAWGGRRHPGPPFEFEIPKGKRVAVEVARRGFITRRVVLDGSKPTVSVGLSMSRRRGPTSRSAPTAGRAAP